MSHLLWQHFWDDDVDKFRRVLAPYSGVSASSTELRTPGQTSSGPFGVAASASGTLTRTDVNSRDYAGLTLLLRASSSPLPTASAFVTALTDHPAVDLYVQDPESGWNALHRSLYAGNVSVARLLLQTERRRRHSPSGPSSSGPALLIKTKDHEGNSPFDLYNATVAGASASAISDLQAVTGFPDSASDSGTSDGHAAV